MGSRGRIRAEQNPYIIIIYTRCEISRVRGKVTCSSVIYITLELLASTFLVLERVNFFNRRMTDVLNIHFRFASLSICLYIIE